MKDIDKGCGNCKWLVDCDNPQNLAVCPEWEDDEIRR